MIFNSFPFNWKTPKGYAAATFVQFIEIMWITQVMSCIMFYFLGIYFFTLAFFADIKMRLKESLDTVAINGSAIDNLRHKELFVDTVKFYYDVKQLSDKFFV